ncbi:MAG: glycosyltransferase [Candidatus Altiarchaeota archaeon]
MKTISIVLPALNEENAVGRTVASIPTEKLKEMGLEVEILVVDNDSSDKTASEALKAGATVESEPKRGYGNAYIRGFSKAGGGFDCYGR